MIYKSKDYHLISISPELTIQLEQTYLFYVDYSSEKVVQFKIIVAKQSGETQFFTH